MRQCKNHYVSLVTSQNGCHVHIRPKKSYSPDTKVQRHWALVCSIVDVGSTKVYLTYDQRLTSINFTTTSKLMICVSECIYFGENH